MTGTALASRHVAKAVSFIGAVSNHDEAAGSNTGNGTIVWPIGVAVGQQVMIMVYGNGTPAISGASVWVLDASGVITNGGNFTKSYHTVSLVSADVSSPPTFSGCTYGGYIVAVFSGGISVDLASSVSAESAVTTDVPAFTKTAKSSVLVGMAVSQYSTSGVKYIAPAGWTDTTANNSLTYFVNDVTYLPSVSYTNGTAVSWTGLSGSAQWSYGAVWEVTGAAGLSNALYLTAPVTTAPTTTVFTTNTQLPTYQQYGDAVADVQMQVPISATVPFLAHTTGGMINLEVWTHSALLQRFTLDANGNASGTLNLSGEVNGPLTMDVYCWNATAANVAMGAFTTQYKQRVHLFMTGGSNYVRPSTPLGASGMSQVFLDDFTALSVSSTDTSQTWYPYQPVGVTFGNALFIDPNAIPSGGVNPFTIVNSFLRIRCQYAPGMANGWTWCTGMLSTGRAGGVSGLYWLPPFYMECRFMFTTGETPWPAFWLVTQEGLTAGAPNENIEIDVTENYGNYPTNWRSGVIHYPLGGGAQINFPIPGASPGTFPSDTLTFDFHTYGILCTTTTVSMYLDNVLIGSVAMPVLGTGPTAFFAMIDNALGGGWPVVVPPAGYYDMWVDYFVVYR